MLRLCTLNPPSLVGDVIEGVDHLHKHKVVLVDNKFENVIVKSNGFRRTASLADFGLVHGEFSRTVFFLPAGFLLRAVVLHARATYLAGILTIFAIYQYFVNPEKNLHSTTAVVGTSIYTCYIY